MIINRMRLGLALFLLLAIALSAIGANPPLPEGVPSAKDTPPATTGSEITLIGNVLCERAFVPPLGTCEKDSPFFPVFIALDGTPEIKAQVETIMKECWPANNILNCEQAKKLNEQWCAKLKYFVGPYPGRDKLHHDIEYGSWYVRVTGVVSEKDGVKWITPSKDVELIRDYAREKMVPAVMLLPDQQLVKAGGKTLTLQVTDKLSFKCILLPAGKFYQGSPFFQIRYQDEFPHEVTLTKPYYMAETPVTQEIFESVMNKNPSTNEGPNKPVESVSMTDIKEFCRVLSEKNQRTVRLPTDAEFEYAARVGNSNPNFDEKYRAQFSHIAVKPAEGIPSLDIRTKQPNGWGLYDMLSCGWHTTSSYKMCNFRGTEVDPPGPATPVQKYVEKDGSRGPLYKSRGGWFYGKVRPNQHGANKDNGGYYEGTPIFRVVVDATPAEIALMEITAPSVIQPATNK